jgi:hypothetical protein
MAKAPENKGTITIVEKGHQGRTLTNDGHRGIAPMKVQGGHQGETSQSAPANPPSGGTKVQPAKPAK